MRYYIIFIVVSFTYALTPVNLIRNANFDEPIVEWDTLYSPTSGCMTRPEFGFPDSTLYYTPPFSVHINSIEEELIDDPGAGYKGEISQTLLVPKKISDIFTLSWRHYVEFLGGERDSSDQYLVLLKGDPYTFWWVYCLGGGSDEHFLKIFNLDMPEGYEWMYDERDIQEDVESKGIDMRNVTIEELRVSSWWSYTGQRKRRGQKVYWDDIKLIGWAYYNRALTQIVSGIPEKNKPYKAKVMLWNNGCNELSVSKIEMIVIKDGTDTVFQDRITKRNIGSNDSLKVSFKEWTPTEDGNYRMEFYTGYLWG